MVQRDLEDVSQEGEHIDEMLLVALSQTMYFVPIVI